MGSDARAFHGYPLTGAVCQHQWDNAAPVAAARATGMAASRVDGSPCRYNERDSLLPDLFIFPPDYVERVRAALA